ncbi:MAG: polyamine aminopropyltransferase [Saprospiraceae bacterium]|nr:MAG: polyamine aminopropyltransferase [Saprospiraceae bacterium]
MTNWNKEKGILGFAIFIAGLCSIVYELLISTTTSYFLGDSIRQFSLTIGIYMAAMGFGSFLSRYFSEKGLLTSFIAVEIALGLIGGSSVPLLYYFFERLSPNNYLLLMIVLTGLIGVLTGFEIPLLARIMKKYYSLRENLANVLGLDYLGALLATLLFPFLLLPFWGIFRTSVFFGLINILLGIFILGFVRKEMAKDLKISFFSLSVLIAGAFAALFYFSKPILQRWDDQLFTHRVVYSEQTPYQHLVLTRNKSDLRLYINRVIQFSSLDEYRYHEALALVPLQLAPYRKRVLVLGGGEGLLVRELLKDSSIQKITVVDLDPAVFALARNNVHLRTLNEGVLDNPRVETLSLDAAEYLRETTELFDLIISDLPDPTNEAVARLYSTHFFRAAKNRLTPNGIFATQASSPFHTRNAYWCIYETLKASGFAEVLPYHAYVPSFGDWGFLIAADIPLPTAAIQLRYPTKFLENGMLNQLFYFTKDIENPGGLSPNRLDQLPLLQYYLEDWAQWSREKVK